MISISLVDRLALPRAWRAVNAIVVFLMNVLFAFWKTVACFDFVTGPLTIRTTLVSLVGKSNRLFDLSCVTRTVPIHLL